MHGVEKTINENSEPVPDVPANYAAKVKRGIILDRVQKANASDIDSIAANIDGIGAIGSKARHDYMIATRLFFDHRMQKFWALVRQRGPTEDYLDSLDKFEKEEEEEYGKPLRSRQRLHEEPIEVALELLAIHIERISFPSDPYYDRDTKTRRREIDRVIGSFRSTSQVLRASGYYDIAVLYLIDTGHLRRYVHSTLDNYREQFIKAFNPSLAQKIAQVENSLPMPKNKSTEELEDWMDSREAITDSLVALEEGTLDEEDINTLFDEIANDINENFNRKTARIFSRRRTGDEEAPESLSEFLDNISEKLESIAETIQPDPFNPRPNEENARLRAFCRKLDYFLRVAFEFSSPTQVAICANVVFDANVDADKVKSWRIDR